MDASTGSLRVRVATFNIRTSHGRDRPNHWWRRRAACLAAIRGFDADIVGLQEVRTRQMWNLSRAFRGWQIVGRGRERIGGEHVSVLVAPGGWTVESSETRWLSPTPDRAGSTGWGAQQPRIVTLVRLRCGRSVLGIANTHLDHRSRDARRHGAELLVDWLAAEPERPWVITGDLNAGPTAEPLQILAAAGYVDSLPPDAGGTEHSFSGAYDRERIDYVLCGPGVRASAAWISHECPHDRLPSDHWPVVADLVLTGASTQSPRPRDSRPR